MGLEVLTPFFTTNKKSLFETYIRFFEEAFLYAEINTPKRMAMFLANCAVETGNYSVFVENLNYSPESLAKTWPNRFRNPDGSVKPIAYKLCFDKELKQVNIANYVYANRYGNSDIASGDGFRFRGRGCGMLTFRDNYEEVDKAFNMNGKLVAMPDMLKMPYWSTFSAAYYWKSRNMNYRADNNHLKVGRKIWNGGSIGLVEMTAIYNRILPILQKEYGA